MQENEEWISLGDLMGGFVAVLMILLVSTLLKSNYNPTSDSIEELRKSIKTQKLDKIIQVSEDGRNLMFADVIFAKSSACIEPEKLAKINLDLRKLFEVYLQTEGFLIFIEGHSDSSPVKGQVANCKIHCGCYDDNLTLSTLRARAFREYIVDDFPPELRKKIAIAGFGEENPLKGIQSDDSRNRRIEVRLINSRESQ